MCTKANSEASNANNEEFNIIDSLTRVVNFENKLDSFLLRNILLILFKVVLAIRFHSNCDLYLLSQLAFVKFMSDDNLGGDKLKLAKMLFEELQIADGLGNFVDLLL